VKGRIWGSRGSIASPGKDTKRYGGNTSCIEIRPPGSDTVILDAGTGIRELGVRLVEEGAERMFLLLTHLHVDHLEGLGMFEPIWRPQTELHIWGPASPLASLQERIAMYFSPPLFPVHLSEVPARIEYHDASESEWQIDGATFSSTAIIHPGPTVGYRVESNGRVLAYLTDHEPALGADLERDPGRWISGFGLAHGADVLIHDCQYTPEEYRTRFGWGHSTTEHAAQLARKAEVDRLMLFHHDPMHADDQLELMRDDVIERWGVDGERCTLAAEGTVFEV
jgi:phosphoribosyl 1,2-cyclic phosphodiesterase